MKDFLASIAIGAICAVYVGILLGVSALIMDYGQDHHCYGIATIVTAAWLVFWIVSGIVFVSSRKDK